MTDTYTISIQLTVGKSKETDEILEPILPQFPYFAEGFERR